MIEKPTTINALILYTYVDHTFGHKADFLEIGGQDTHTEK